MTRPHDDVQDPLLDLLEGPRASAPVPDRAPRWQQGNFDTPEFLPADESFGERRRRGGSVREATKAARVAHSPIAVRAPIEDLSDIAEGGLRTQHETGYSRGFYGPEDRSKFEINTAGFSDHPVYGYMDIPEHESAASHYGEAKIRMRPHVRDRTTVMEGDSLDSRNQPAPVNDVASGRTPLPKWTDEGPAFDDSDLGYYEAQIHHPEDVESASYSTVSRRPLSRVPVTDMASVDLDWEQYEDFRENALDQNDVANWDPEWGPDYMDRESRRNLGQQFADQGVSVWHQERKHAYQPPLDLGEETLSEAGFRPASRYFEGAQEGDLHQHAANPQRPSDWSPLNAFQFREERHQQDY